MSALAGNRSRFQDLTGRKFGRLLVLSELPEAQRRDRRRTEYLCQCACGVTKPIVAEALRRHKTKSCGCLAREPHANKAGHSRSRIRTASAVELRNHAWRDYRRNARTHGRPFTLTKEQFSTLLFSSCIYCAAPPAPRNGVDRIDNAVGYVPGNVVACCRTCNWAKGSMSATEFVGWATRVAAFTQRHQAQKEAA